MTQATTEVLVAGYRDVDTASEDFDDLIARVAAKEVAIEAAILVAHDAEGNVTVQQTGDRLGRRRRGSRCTRRQIRRAQARGGPPRQAR
jgi:hypothetical protein